MFLILVALLALAPLPAHADPTTIVATLAPYIGGSAAAFVASAAVFVAANATWITLGYNVLSAASQRRAARRAAARAKADYNASLQDRMLTGPSAEPNERYFYGAGITGGDVVAIFTSDKTLDDGSIKRDAYKHLVIVITAHRIKAIKDVLIDGVRLGIAGMTGWATSTEFAKGKTYTTSHDAAGTARTVVLPSVPVNVLSVTATPVSGAYFVAQFPGFSVSGSTVTLGDYVTWRGENTFMDASMEWHINYETTASDGSSVFVSKFLGSDTQTADAYLMSKVPSQWTSSDRLQGCSGVVMTLDLEEEQRFQSGLPRITFDIEGRDEIFDPRDSSTGYTTNAALCIDDWLRSRWGFGVVPDPAYTIAAANACAVSTSFVTLVFPPDGYGPPSTLTETGPRYTINGAWTSGDDKESVLSEMVAAMGGRVINGADWYILAGAWEAPVRDLAEADEAGPIQIIQTGEGIDDIFNGVRASFIPAGESTVSDIRPPYQATTFVTADGGELWEDMTFQFTDHAQRARNLARIATEVNRNGLVVQYPAKIKHWDLRVGQRVRVSSAEYGWTLKAFLITDWQFGLNTSVVLRLQEDNEEAYDEADSALVDPTPNSGLPNPYVVPQVTGLATSSGTADLLKTQDGTIVPRVRVSWTQVPAAYMEQGYIELAWRTDPAADWTLVRAGGQDTEAFLLGMPESVVVYIRVTAVNSVLAKSPPAFIDEYVLGKSAAPGAVTGLASTAVIGGASLTWDANTELDYADTELREGLSWTVSGQIFKGKASAFSWAVPDGSYTIWAKHFDTSGNESSTAASLSVVVASSTAVLFTLESSAAAFLLPADNAGVVSSYSGAASTIKVLTGAADDTANWTLARTDGSGVTSTLSAGVLTITALASGTDLSYVDVTATRTGYATLTKRIAVGKSKAGATGTPGSPGSPGAPGSPGSPGSPGADGANGRRTAIATAFRWALTIPTTPSGSATYTWAGGGISAAPTLWSLTPGTTPVPGYTLWALDVVISNTNTTTTDSFNWSSGGIRSAGSSGDAGDSARIAYTAITSGTTLATGTRTSTGSTTPPSTNAWGGSETWSMTPPSVSTGQTQWQTNGVYVKATDTITWETPYTSFFKVGALSAITANLGTVTAGTITGLLIQTATSGRRVVINESGSNTARFYDDAGGGTELLASIGPTSYGTSYALGDFGSITSGNATIGVRGRSYSYIGVFGKSINGKGVEGDSNINDGVFGTTNSTSTDYAGVQGYNNVSAGCAVKGLATGGAIGVYSDANGNIAFKGEGAISIAKGTATHDPYGTVSVTRPTGASYSYYGMTEAGTQPIGIGIDTAHQCWIGVPTSGHNGVLSARYLTTGYNGTKVEGAFGCNGKSPQTAYTVPAAGSDALVNAIRTALINCGICV